MTFSRYKAGKVQTVSLCIAQKRATSADLVFGVRRAGVDGLNDNVGVEKMRGDHVGDERGVVFLENDRHYVVADVTFSLKLLTPKKIHTQ